VIKVGPIALAMDVTRRFWRRVGLALLVGSYIVICCVAFRLAYPHYRELYILYNEAYLYRAAAVVAGFATIAPIFLFARFSFGYFCGFYFYSMILGYLWLNSFSQFQYNHVLAGISAGVSAAAFLLPALFVTSPIKRRPEVSERAFERILLLIVLFSLATAIVTAFFNFRFVSIGNIYDYRGQLAFPWIANYSIGIVTTVFLPFAFACFVVREEKSKAALVLFISASFYPITLTKLALFTPAWLVMLALISKLAGSRKTAILSLLLPVLTGVILILVIGEPARQYYNIVNMRMLIIPSSAMDIYNEYFARHPLTHFCQMWAVKPFVSCALEHPLSIEMHNIYALGNFNASLFATEGIASVGLWFAPISAFVCGLLVAFGNRLSAGLSPRFILLSSGILPQILLNVPFSTVLLTHGLGLAYLLWYVTPRSKFGGE
jgi:hypothetical protein